LVRHFFELCGEDANPKSEARNPKGFDQLTTLSHVEGQYPMIQFQMTEIRYPAAFLFWAWGHLCFEIVSNFDIRI